jgi:cytochrome c oxidase cbb3-type subunit 3
LAAALNPKPRDHTAGEHMNGLTDDYLFNLIKNGGGAVDKSRLMPAFGGQLEDRDIRNLIAYIRSLARPPYKP